MQQAITNKKLSKFSGLAQSTLSKLSKDKGHLSVSRAKDVAKLTGAPLPILLVGSGADKIDALKNAFKQRMQTEKLALDSLMA